MNSLNNNAVISKTFDFHNHNVHVFNINGVIWFLGDDVAKTLGYKSYRAAVSKHVDYEDKHRFHFGNAGQKRLVTFINEPGVYALIFGSKLPSAHKFKHWVTHDVLPSIRKTGSYSLNKPISFTDKLLQRDKEEIALINKNRNQQQLNYKQQKQIKHLTPYARLGQVVKSAKTNITVHQMAKLLDQFGFKTGAYRLYHWLRDVGLVCRSRTLRNVPTQYALKLSLLKSRTKHFVRNGNIYLYYLTVVTPNSILSII